MPRYFFHVSAGQDIEDGEGSDLPSLGEAKIEAVKVAAMLLAWTHTFCRAHQDDGASQPNSSLASLPNKADCCPTTRARSHRAGLRPQRRSD